MQNSKALMRTRSKVMSIILLSGLASTALCNQQSGSEKDVIMLDSGVRIELRTTTDQDGNPRRVYQFIDPDGSISQSFEQRNLIKLRNQTFDPVVEDYKSNIARLQSSNPELWIVQYRTAPRVEYRESIEKAGGKLLPGYLPDQACIVRMSSKAAAELSELPWIRWIGEIEPEMKLPSDIVLDELTAEDPEDYRLTIFPPSVKSQARLADIVDLHGGIVTGSKVSGTSLDVRVGPAALKAVIQSEDCVSVSRIGEFHFSSADSRITSGADVLAMAGPYTGTGVRAAVDDSAMKIVNPVMDALIHDPIIRFNADNMTNIDIKHGTSVYSVVFANTNTQPYPQVAGVMPSAQGVFTSTIAYAGIGNQGSLGYDRDCVVRPLVQAVSDPLDPIFVDGYRTVVSSNSWGDYLGRDYTNHSLETDRISFHYKLLLMHSTSNLGVGDIGGQSIAKNVLSVGGFNHHGTPLDRSDDVWESYAGPGGSLTSAPGIGPVDTDQFGLGRVKPDLVQPAHSVWVASSGESSSPGSPPEDVRQVDGTSFAVPTVAGCAGLVFEMWGREFPLGSSSTSNIFRQSLSSTTGVPDTDVFANRPAPSVVKAMLINMASPYDWNQDNDSDGIVDDPSVTPNNSITRDVQGWGVPDLKKIYSRAAWYNVTDLENSQCQSSSGAPPVMYISPEEVSLSTRNTVHSSCFEVLSTDTELRGTLVWSDPPPSSLGGGSPLVNDLDLEITAPDGTTVYNGNWGLVDNGAVPPNHGIWSSSGGSPDTINNVENIFIPAEDLQAGIYQVRVKLSSLNADGNMPEWTACAPHTPKLDDGTIDATFALVVTRGPCIADFDQNGVVNSLDSDLFVSEYSSGEARADLTCDGVFDIFDVTAFLEDFNDGCP